MPTLEDHLVGIINIFHQYSVRLGHHDTLTKSELKLFITRELANIIKNSSDPATINKIFQELDENGDDQINFREFLFLVASVLETAHDNIHKE
ncbi:protein S100-A12-like [Perognathus longimembris pacificus]|uniref:protein S100-A12-like n=1 Tax=Perognathus longimembris pacificus TaxID=214514 RepID=UPI00201929ED|nr:protein S100-A12-like [Perognathus longimembris pacificus]